MPHIRWRQLLHMHDGVISAAGAMQPSHPPWLPGTPRWAPLTRHLALEHPASPAALWLSAGPNGRQSAVHSSTKIVFSWQCSARAVTLKGNTGWKQVEAVQRGGTHTRAVDPEWATQSELSHTCPFASTKRNLRPSRLMCCRSLRCLMASLVRDIAWLALSPPLARLA